MPSRRDFLLASLGFMFLPRLLVASTRPGGSSSWEQFARKMKTLAVQYAAGSVRQPEVVDHGLELMRQLDISDDAFIRATSESFESGNRFWLWQRLTRESGLNGGILTIEKEQPVPLHDHPGATGMLRVLEGELEVWQFDRLQGSASHRDKEHAVLQRVSRRILHPGDTALLSPDKGNIHALRAISRECSMLDYFIPPYVRSARTWYEPEEPDWFSADRITCKAVPENDFSTS